MEVPQRRRRKQSLDEQETEGVPTAIELIEFIKSQSDPDFSDEYTVFLAQIANSGLVELPRSMTYQSALDLL